LVNSNYSTASTHQFSRILLVRLRRIGDVVLTTPAIKALRETFRDAQISYIVEPLAAPIVERNPHLDEVIVAADPDAPRRLLKDLKLGVDLRRRRFDLAIDFHGGPRSSWFTWASGAPVRIGYQVVGRSWMYTLQVARPRELRARHTVENQWDLLEPLGIPRPTPDSHPTDVPLDSRATEAVERWLQDYGIGANERVVVVHVGARIHFRRWPPEHFVDAIADIARADPRTRFVVIAGPGEDTADRVVAGARKRLPEPRRAAVFDPRVWTLDELQALAARAALYIGCDTGPLHLAGTTSVPIVGLYGPTLPATWQPWRATSSRTIPLEVLGLPCRPCDQRVCEPGDFRCLIRIGPQQVVDAAIKCLEP
jgi:ADP-heptose:LPS heptosyltransferase